MRPVASTLLFLLLSTSILLHSQTNSSVRGILADSSTGKPIVGATIKVLDKSVLLGGAISDSRGRFHVSNIVAGQHSLVCRSIGFDSLRKSIRVRENDTTDLGTIQLSPSTTSTETITVEEQGIQVDVKGDTIEYNAKQFKTDQNASADELVKKMPGIDVSNGQVKAQGENVRRVLVDGKPFFGDDPNTTLKNLPSDIIDKVQVFDQLSDQASFTKIDDGERNKTLNIITKADRRNGQFGKVYGGYGSDDRYTGGGNVNFFGGDRRMSLILLSNNINQQNFSISDILGATGMGGGMMARFATSSGSRMFTGGGNRGSGGFRGMGGGGVSDFLVGQSDGITQSNGLGLNYSDSWGKEFDLSGSYFVNYSDNNANQSTRRENFLAGTTQSVISADSSTMQNLNHRVNLRTTWSIDSSSSIVFSPRLTWQGNDKKANSLSATKSLTDTINSLDNNTTSDGTGRNIGAELLYRLRFAADGRTLSMNVSGSDNESQTDQITNSNTVFYNAGSDSMFQLHQTIPSVGVTRRYGSNISYTEPIVKNHLLSLSYNYNQNFSENDRKTKNNLLVDIDSLSNISSTTYITHKVGASYRFTLDKEKDTSAKNAPSLMSIMMGPGAEKQASRSGGGDMMRMMNTGVGQWVFSGGVDYQRAVLDVEQTFPQNFVASKIFHNFLPNISITTRPTVFSNIRLNYRTSTNQPTIQQLQTVLDNSNPTLMSIGNVDLSQELNHNLFLNYGTFDMSSAVAFYTMVTATLTKDKIVDVTQLSIRGNQEVVLSAGDTVVLPKGSRLSSYANRNGYANSSFFSVVSFPWEVFSGLKLNFNTGLGANYTRDLSLINNVENIIHTTTLTPNINISSNISEYTDLGLSWSGAINQVRNTIQSENNSDFFTNTFNVSTTLINHDTLSSFLDGWLFVGSLNYVINRGLSSGFNQVVPLLNLGIGKRFLENRAELKLQVFDALNKNVTIARSTGSGFQSDTQTATLQRYFLLNFTYNLRMWGGGSGASGVKMP